MSTPAFDTHEYVRLLEEGSVSKAQAEAHLKAIQVVVNPLTEKMFHKLDSTDFENIYLQVRNRGWKWFIALASVFLGGTIFVAWQVLNQSVSSAVDKYVTTEKFQKDVVATAMSRIEKLESRLLNLDREIALAEKRAGVLGDLPLAISATGLTITGRDGKNYFFESGIVRSGEQIQFKSAFRVRPFLMINERGRSVGGKEIGIDPRRHRQQDLFIYGPDGRLALFMMNKDERSGFKIRAESVSKVYEWIAIGE